MPPHEFVCADCKADVFSFGDLMSGPRCASCEVVAELKAEKGLTPEAENDLRRLLGCELPKEEA